MTAGALTELAPAKVNLALHVTGRRADGYHLLDSLVVFADLGDRVTAAPSDGLSLALDGPFAADLAADLDAGADNLVLRAAALLCDGRRGAALRLTKSLPLAAGIGGGSSDAAATLRLLARMWDVPAPDAAALLRLGADVPVCHAGRSARMRGVGGDLAPVTLPPLWLVLVNPGVALSTAAVFGAWSGPGRPMADPGPLPDLAALVAYLAAQRNDLEPPARALAPAMDTARAALEAAPGCRFVRMSGSGATWFGLFDGAAAARAAAVAIGTAAPHWWVAAAPSLNR